MLLKKASPLSIAIACVAFSIAGCKPTPPVDDTVLNSALQARLTSDAAIGSEPIQTFVQGGVATLQGTVSSEAAKALAASDAAQVVGIKSVTNQLSVQTAQTVSPASAAVATVAPPPPPSRAARPGKPSARVEMPAKRPPAKAYDPQPPAPYPTAPIERRPLLPDQQAAAPPLEHRPMTPPAPSFRTVTVPAGTTLSVRITQTLDSATTQAGELFSGSLASDVLVDGLVAFAAGTTISGKVTEVHEAARFKGSSLLTLSLVNINRRGDPLPISTDSFSKSGEGRGKNTAEKVGGGAAVGAILGGIFGGGKGAAIGAATGGGLGAGAQGLSKGQQVQIPSETLLRFRLTSPIDVRAAAIPSSEGDANLQRHDSN
jgi:hypothetical protein